MNDPFEDKSTDEPEEMNEMDGEPEENSPPVNGEWDTYGIPLDIIADDGSLIIGHPVFTVAIDSATRAIFAIHTHSESPDAEEDEGKGKEPCL